MSLVTTFCWNAYHGQRNSSHYKATMHVFVPWKYICVTIVQMKCTHAKCGKTELRSRHNKALSVVHTHMVHQYSQVESTKCYSPHYIQYIRTSTKQSHALHRLHCWLEKVEWHHLEMQIWKLFFNAYQRHCHFAPHTMLTNDCSLPLPLFSYVLYRKVTVSLEIQTRFLRTSSAKSFSTYVRYVA